MSLCHPPFRCKTSCVYSHRLTGISPLCYWFFVAGPWKRLHEPYKLFQMISPPHLPCPLLLCIRGQQRGRMRAWQWKMARLSGRLWHRLSLSNELLEPPLAAWYNPNKAKNDARSGSSWKWTLKSTADQYSGCGFKRGPRKPHTCSSHFLMVFSLSITIIEVRPVLLHHHVEYWCQWTGLQTCKFIGWWLQRIFAAVKPNDMLVLQLLLES